MLRRQNQRSVRKLKSLIRRMGRKDDCELAVGQPTCQDQKPGLIGKVQMGGRLIQDHRFWRLHEDARNLHQLPLAAADFRARRLGQMKNSKRPQGFERGLGRFPSGCDRLLAAASELFYQKGAQSVGIDKVIERAGVAKASLYSNFKGKDDLVRACLDARHQARRAGIEAEMTRHKAPRDKLLAFSMPLRKPRHGLAIVAVPSSAQAPRCPTMRAVERSAVTRVIGRESA